MTAPKLATRGLNVYYGEKHAIKDVTLEIPERQVTAFIGPSGCGKSTVLRCFNRMNDTVAGARVTGEMTLDGGDLYAVEVTELRRRIGMVFQKSNPFPMSVFDNVAYGLRVESPPPKDELAQRVEHALRRAALWDEVSDRLQEPALGLSGGQQQRLCIARALAVEPEVILMDEPASALDPIATAKLEELIRALVDVYTVVIVTHNMQQAQRLSHLTAFFYLGELIEMDETRRVFEAPREKQTRDYVAGVFG